MAPKRSKYYSGLCRHILSDKRNRRKLQSDFDQEVTAEAEKQLYSNMKRNLDEFEKKEQERISSRVYQIKQEREYHNILSHFN